MNNKMPSRETINHLREQFPVGCRVELVEMNDPYAKLQPGEQGIIEHVDRIGTIFVKWDCGSGLGVAYGEDKIKRI